MTFEPNLAILASAKTIRGECAIPVPVNHRAGRFVSLGGAAALVRSRLKYKFVGVTMKGLVAVLLLGLVFSACSSSARKKINRDNKPTQAEQNLNEDFDPSTLSEPAVTIPPKKKVDKNTSDIEMFAAPKDTMESAEEIGYRIQILQTEDAQEAREAQKDAILALDIDAYLIYDNPYYKVRLGDFHTRYEAEEYLQKVILKGHGSAWIVRTHIKPHLGKEQNQ